MTGAPEQKLARLFGYEHAVMAGRARSALVALIEVFQDGAAGPLPVLLPENICPVLGIAIRAGGGLAVPVPVSPLSGLPDDRAFTEAMMDCERPGIVMPTHLYGFVGDYPEMTDYARAHGWVIVENDTNAVRLQGAAPFGDALLTSFGYAKPIEVGSGGALMTSDRSLARALRQRVSSYDMLDSKAEKLEEKYMLERRAIRKNMGTSSRELARICQGESALVRFRFDDKNTARLVAQLDRFPGERSRRLERREMWNRALAPLDDMLQPVPLPQPVPWRLIRRVPEGRDIFTRHLWAGGVDAGINYRSLWRELPAEYLSGTPSLSDPWGEMVLNLWVTGDYDGPRIEKAAHKLMEAANDL